MTVKSFVVKPLPIKEIKDFVEKWHYSQSVNGITATNCFGLFNGEQLIGGMIYGKLGMANAWKKYALNAADVIELRRLCCIDETPKNTESYFIGKTLKWLKTNTDYKIVVSYADTNHGHNGTIYKASNFDYLGMTAKSKKIKHGEKSYHDKAIRTYYTNRHGEKVLKPFAKNLLQALASGDAHYVDTGRKHIYVYKLKK